MKKRILILLCIILALSSCPLTFAAVTVHNFYDGGSKYGIHLYQNSTADPSYAAGWGGMDGITDKTLSTDAVLFVDGAIITDSKNCTGIGLLVDGQNTAWLDCNLTHAEFAYGGIGYFSEGYYLGPNGFTFEFSFDTSKLSNGNHVLKIVCYLDGEIYEIGSRTPDYGVGCTIINAASTGSHYDPDIFSSAPSEPTPYTPDEPDEPNYDVELDTAFYADFNSDGECDLNDATYFLKNIMNGEYYHIDTFGFRDVDSIDFDDDGSVTFEYFSGESETFEDVDNLFLNRKGKIVAEYSDGISDYLDFDTGSDRSMRCDVDNDGELTIDDVAYYLKYITNGNVYPLSMVGYDNIDSIHVGAGRDVTVKNCDGCALDLGQNVASLSRDVKDIVANYDGDVSETVELTEEGISEADYVKHAFDEYEQYLAWDPVYFDRSENPFAAEAGGIYFGNDNDNFKRITFDEYALNAADYLLKSVPNATFDADVYCIPCVGQSLAVNTDAGPSTFNRTFELSYDTSLNNVNLQDMNTGFCEGFKLLADKYGITLPENFKIITFVVGTGGTSINTFVKGTSHYNQIKSGVQTAYNTCRNRGLSMIVPGFMWTQGEEDMRCGGVKSSYGSGDWNPYDYSTKLMQIRRDLETDIKKITKQTQSVEIYTYQVASHNAYYRYPRIALEQLEAAQTDSHIIMAKPNYDITYNVADYVHAPASSYRNMGNYYGMACFVRSVLHADFEYTHVTNVENNGTEVILEYEVPVKPLSLDTELITNLEDGNYGFDIYNVPGEFTNSSSQFGLSESQTKILKVEIVSPTKVKLTLNRALRSGDRLTYGVNGVGYRNITGYCLTGEPDRSGPVEGARGCIRDSSAVVNNNSGSVMHDLYSRGTIWEYVVE